MMIRTVGLKKFRSPLAALLFTTLLSIGSAASAAPINLAETTDFDGVSGNAFVSFTSGGTLDVGLNQISGSFANADADNVQVTLPASLQIDSVDLVISNHVDSTIGSTTIRTNVVFPADVSVLLVPSLSDGNGTFNLVTGPVVTPGLYNFHIFPLDAIPGNSSDYLWQINVSGSVIPEPASATLLCLGSVMLLRRRRRRCA